MAWDGKKGSTWTREHLAACEVRMLLTWPKERRAGYYAKVREKRGPESARALIESVNEAWRLANEPARA